MSFLLSFSAAQTFYAGGLDGLYEITISGGTCSSTFIGPFIDQATGNTVFSGDIAICPDGTLYITDNTNLWEVDPATGNSTLVASSSTYLGIVGLGCAGNGLVYGTAFSVNGVNGGLYAMDPNAGTISLIGETGFSSAGDIVNYNGTWYMTSSAGLIEVDVNTPSNSTLALPGISYVAMTVFPGDCNTLLGGDGSNLFTIDIDDGSVNSFCTVPGVQIGGLTTISEFASLPTSCDPTLDLDGDDSSGALGFDFNAPNFNCSTIDGVNIADLDAEIDSDEAIQTLTVTISSGNSDGFNEILELLAANNISITGSGTGTLTLTNTGGASIIDFTTALTNIVYVNQLIPPTSGLREIEVSFTTISGAESNTAISFINVDAFENLEVDLGPDLFLCPDEMAILDAGNPSANFIWSNSSTQQVISATAPGSFSVTVSDDVNCPGSDTITLNLEEVYQLGLSGDDSICENEVAELTFSLGSPVPNIDVTLNESPSGNQIFLQNVTDGFSFQVTPSETSTYTIVIVNDNGFCLEDFSGLSWTVVVGESTLTEQSFQLCEGDSLFLGGAWQFSPGVYVENLFTSLGCDSVIESTLAIIPAVTEFISSTTCNPSEEGVFETVWPAANGCDSTVIETVTFVGLPVTELNTTTCDPSQVGVSSQIFTSVQGCDSTVLTTTNFLPSDTTAVVETSCNPNNTGTFTEVFSNIFGCDSIVITTVSFTQSDTTEIFESSCDPDDVGTFSLTLTNAGGCDSTVITTISFAQSDTTYVEMESCDPDDSGVFTQILTGANGCDSTVITTVTFTPIDDTFVFETSCDSSQTGIVVDVFSAQSGCDSVVFTQTDLLTADQTLLTFESCNPDDVGTFTETLTNQFGCDSTVITTVSFTQSDTTEIFESSCDPDDVGTFSLTLTNAGGCDSTVITTISFAQSDTTYVEMESCDPDDSGVFTQILTGANGCDSTVITTVTFTPIDDTFVFETSCDSSQTGIVVDVFSAQSGCDSVVFTQTDLLTADQTLLTFESCNPDDVGTFTETLTNQFGCDSTVITEVTLSTGSPVFISSQTCTPDEVGTFTEIFTDQFGCDSTVITSVSLSPSDTTFLSSQTCDPSGAGVFTENLSNQFGCDSLVVTSVELLISDTVFLTSQTCDPSGIGIFSEIFTNQFGCDSTIINTVELSPTDTTYLFDSSCDLSEVGVFEENWTNQAGCDSLVVTEVSLALGDTTYLSLNTCDEEAVGIFTENIAVPNGCDSVTITTVSLSPPSTTVLTESVCEIDQTGVFEVILVGENGCDSIVTTVVSLLPIEDCESARPSIYVPNAFSPNGDGINDYFLIFGNEEVRQILTIEVFSRWGERVFEAFDIPVNNLQYGWDGSFRGEPMGTGVFAFWAEVEMNDGSRQMVKGDVMLIR